ncbi:ATP-binding cassette domain-containing protein [Clostridia bacterium]|nr:ATP-binding cassette domain-containing protein [Clostridia bacterium]
MGNQMISFQNFSWTYEGYEKKALNDITLEVGKGEFIGIMGQNDSGKTTLCRAINGLIPHRFKGDLGGNVILAGQYDSFDTDLATLAQKVGMVGSDPSAQFLRGTVEEEIVFVAENMGLNVSEIEERLKNVLRTVNVSDEFLQKAPTDLSGGQKQRVAIAAALMARPEIIVLDEPTSQVDPMGKQEIIEVVEKLRKEHDMTVVLVEHRSNEILEYADHVALVHNGDLIMHEPPKIFFRQVNKLLEYGVYPPQIAQFGNDVIRDPDFAYLGFTNDDIPLTVDEGYDFILNALKRREKKNVVS